MLTVSLEFYRNANKTILTIHLYGYVKRPKIVGKLLAIYLYQ